MTPEDHTAISDLLNRHGHLIDSGDFDGAATLFTPDAVYDVTALGGGILVGATAFREAALALGDANPVAHHVTNIVLEEAGPDRVHALSKGLGVMTNGTVGSVTYEDTIERVDAGWRITHRIVHPRRRPLHP
ncbi:nuclear transport factor 2 family protein [Actinoplanes bogorensis]|uniref:Nuclear transport factor 2 family protein n=1 Tax=Paractinoplanes bogorensis TaxID=1610840 RepID=A0ABS5YRZ9_9ACTN|nr:nuclear transport factor 2 family protein [Actinoplanes bogorensis]MBU2666091.1 nuclear transport factor 2 family protein [Actinoplanes bogorensis]